MTTLYAFGAGLILIGGLIWFIVRMARKLGRRDSIETEVDHAQQGNEIDERVHTLSDDDRRKWLHGRK